MKKILISTMVATLLFSGVTLSAEEGTDNKTISKSIKVSVEKERQKQKESFKEAPKEIVEGFNQTLDAIKSLEDKHVDKAKKALESASKNFTKALKERPELDFVPYFQEVLVHEFVGDSAHVKKALTLVEMLISKYDTQAARAVMMPLEDEMVIRTDAIPMKLYPLATEKALNALNKGNREEALDILKVSLDTIVSETMILPLPLLVGEDLVTAASLLNKVEKENALGLLSLAQDELKKAVYLGYTKKHDPAYKALDKEIELIKKEIKGKNIVEKLYDKLKESFHALIGKSREDSQNK